MDGRSVEGWWQLVGTVGPVLAEALLTRPGADRRKLDWCDAQTAPYPDLAADRWLVGMLVCGFVRVGVF